MIKFVITEILHKHKVNRQFVYILIILIRNLHCEIIADNKYNSQLKPNENFITPDNSNQENGDFVIEYESIIFDGNGDRIKMIEDSIVHEINGTIEKISTCLCPNGYCVDNECICHVYYEFVNGFCQPCPDVDMDCRKCCFGDHLECLRGYCVAINVIQESDNAFIFITASQVILATGIILGITGLATILLKYCSRPQRFVQPARAELVTDPFQRTWMRVSVSSLQQRVLNKLRDRPPRYETRHNYEFRQSRDNRNGVPTSIPTISRNFYNEPPPSYEAENATDTERGTTTDCMHPPSYEKVAPENSLIIQFPVVNNHNQPSSDPDSSSEAGISNLAFNGDGPSVISNEMSNSSSISESNPSSTFSTSN